MQTLLVGPRSWTCDLHDQPAPHCLLWANETVLALRTLESRHSFYLSSILCMPASVLIASWNPKPPRGVFSTFSQKKWRPRGIRAHTGLSRTPTYVLLPKPDDIWSHWMGRLWAFPKPASGLRVFKPCVVPHSPHNQSLENTDLMRQRLRHWYSWVSLAAPL